LGKKKRNDQNREERKLRILRKKGREKESERKPKGKPGKKKTYGKFTTTHERNREGQKNKNDSEWSVLRGGGGTGGGGE